MLTSDLILKVGVQAQLLLGPGDNPTPTPTSTGDAPTTSQIVNSHGIQTWLIQTIAPILLAVFGIWILARSKRGNVSEVVTSSGITMLGIVFLGGAAVLPFLGDNIVNLVFGK